MDEPHDRRAELRARYDERTPQAAVYLLRHRPSGRILIGSTPDLASLRNRLSFGAATSSPGVLDRRLLEDARRDGVGAFELEVLDTIEADRKATSEAVRADLEVLEVLWREKLATSPQY